MKRVSEFKESESKKVVVAETKFVGPSLSSYGDVLLSVIWAILPYADNYPKARICFSLISQAFCRAVRFTGLLTRVQRQLLQRLCELKSTESIFDNFKIPDSHVITDNVGAGKTTVMLVFAAQQAALGKTVVIYAAIPIVADCCQRLASMMTKGEIPTVRTEVFGRFTRSCPNPVRLILWERGTSELLPENTDIVLVDDKSNREIPSALMICLEDFRKTELPTPLVVFFRSGGYSNAKITAPIETQLERPKVDAQFIYTGLCFGCRPDRECSLMNMERRSLKTPLIKLLDELTCNSKKILIYVGVARELREESTMVLNNWATAKVGINKVITVTGVKGVYEKITQFNEFKGTAALFIGTKSALSGLTIAADTVLMLDCFAPNIHSRAYVESLGHVMCNPCISEKRSLTCKRSSTSNRYFHPYGQNWPAYRDAHSPFNSTKVVHQVLGRAIRPGAANTVKVIAISNTSIALGVFADALAHLLTSQKQPYTKHERRVDVVRGRFMLEQIQSDNWKPPKFVIEGPDHWYQLRSWRHIDRIVKDELVQEYKHLAITKLISENEDVDIYSLKPYIQ